MRRRLRQLIVRLRGGAADGHVEREIREELQFHIAMRTRKNVEAGMDSRAARRAAERSFGDADRVLRAGREILAGEPPAGEGRGFLDSVGQDVRFGLRVLRRNPLPTVAALVTLALGIGANAANFGIVYGFLHRPLPFDNGERLVFIDAWNPDRGDGDAPITQAEFTRLRESGLFEHLGGYLGRSLTVVGDDYPTRLAGASVTPGVLRALGIQPQLGRLFDVADAARIGFEEVVLISDGLWRTAFGADPDVVGRPLRVNDRDLTVIGVMPDGFRFPRNELAWLPIAVDAPNDHERRMLRGIGVLAEGVALGAAREQIDSISNTAATAWPETHRGWNMRAMWFRHGFIDEGARRSLYAMFFAVAMVLLLACVNVANLQMSRAPARRRELVVRAALGASRARLVRQVLTENVLLGAAGGLLGLAIAALWVRAVSALATDEVAAWIDVSLDGVTIAYTCLVALGTGVLFGVLPALRLPGRRLRDDMGGDRGTTRGRLRGVLVVGEIALALALLVGASLMIRSFMEIQRADPGFDIDPLLSLRVVLAGDRYDEVAARSAYFADVRTQLEALPGVVAAAATGAIPADDGGADVPVFPEVGDVSPDEPLYAIAVPSTAGFFATLAIEPLRGRVLTEAETRDPDTDAVVLGASLAGRLWPGEDPLGRRLRFGPEGRWWRVVGVVRDLQYEEFGEDNASARLQVHLPYGPIGWRGMALMVRAAGDPEAAIESVRDALAAVDPGQAPYDIYSMTERRRVNSWGERTVGQSFGAFGAMALVLALFGVYAVIAHSVAQRVPEFGVRMALGARPRDLLRQVMVSGGRLVLIGIVLGSALAAMLTTAMQGVLFGVSAHDPATFIGAALALGIAALAASLIPGRRAANVSPTEALRAD